MAQAERGDILSFGDWVQQRRLALGLTRPALARQVGCSAITIKKIERDERRPSQQIAALLADQLVLPEQDRDHFMRMARGEVAADRLTSPDVISLPPFLWPSAAVEQETAPPLVAREDELNKLAAYLDAALLGNGGVVFITGEAGDGKTMLAQSFVRQSQAHHDDLVVANGNCNAYTGIGDPYLPFREILELLTGDIESRWAAGALSQSYAERLWRLAPYTVQALIEAGPDLVDTFVFGPALIARAAAVAPAGSPTADLAHTKDSVEQLHALVARHQERQAPAHLHQSNLFAQYSRVLQHLARRQPLLLIIDDLQWADAGSISLLFHLGRQLKGQRILIIGIYRAAEVALGRNGERHPLEPIVNELQRHFGEIHVRLNQTEGRRFIDAILDVEPNRLGSDFREALYRQTGGHPLFTVEMVHGLQERGDLVQNEAGEWVEGPVLDWMILPARVEGVIRERIGRLPPTLQELLKVASVEGEIFSAEIVAHVQAREERQVATELGAMLDQQQRLVKIQGSQHIGPKQLSQYRFRHILFQQYLYNSLDQMSRVYFHRAIANELAELYGEQTQVIAPQLARHYALAGENQRALPYFILAGDMAAAVYAHTEAEAHYRRALAISKTAPPARAEPRARDTQLTDLYGRLGRTLELDAHYDRAIALYEEMEAVGAARNNQSMVLASLLARATIRTTVNFARDPAQGQVLLESARGLARKLGKRAAEAQILWNLLILSAYTGGDVMQRLAYGEQALTLVRALDLPEQLAFTLHDIFYAYAGAGQWIRARSALYEARELWRKLGNLPMLAETQMRLHWSYLVTGKYEQALAHAAEAYRLGQESHNLDAQALSHFMIGFVYWERGEIEQALTTMEEDIAIAASVNSLTPLTGTRADLGLLYGELGDLEHGLALANLARTTAEEQLPILRFWPHAVQVILNLRQGNHAAAAALIATLADYRTVKEQFGYMPFMWLRVGLAQGEFALQQQEYAQAVTLLDELQQDLAATGIWYLRPDVLHLRGRALLGLDNVAAAYDALLEARAAAETLGSRRALWPILASLAEVARQNDDPTAAERLREEARAIVEEMAHHIGTPTLRNMLLGLPQVKALRSV
ncbi:MAG: AAA family ATPase [Caldilineaceae bacterium]